MCRASFLLNSMPQLVPTPTTQHQTTICMAHAMPIVSTPIDTQHPLKLHPFCYTPPQQGMHRKRTPRGESHNRTHQLTTKSGRPANNRDQKTLATDQPQQIQLGMHHHRYHSNKTCQQALPPDTATKTRSGTVHTINIKNPSSTPAPSTCSANQADITPPCQPIKGPGAQTITTSCEALQHRFPGDTSAVTTHYPARTSALGRRTAGNSRGLSTVTSALLLLLQAQIVGLASRHKQHNRAQKPQQAYMRIRCLAQTLLAAAAAVMPAAAVAPAAPAAAAIPAAAAVSPSAAAAGAAATEPAAH